MSFSSSVLYFECPSSLVPPFMQTHWACAPSPSYLHALPRAQHCPHSYFCQWQLQISPAHKCSEKKNNVSRRELISRNCHLLFLGYIRWMVTGFLGRSLGSVSLPEIPPCSYAFTSLMPELNTSKKQLKNFKLPTSLIIVTKRISHPHVIFPLY